ncbi:MAG: CBS domain-containing protein [Bacteriovorax sp.]|nr:CBS domain-containing protein [Bacteriovorax sp.]
MTQARSLMTKRIIKVKPEMPIQAAYDEMKEHSIRHLPVIDSVGKLVGILSDRDVQRAINVKQINEIEQEMTFNPHETVEDYMNWPVQTVDENSSIEDLTKMMIDLKLSAVIISGANQFIQGIITTEDLLKYLLELLASSEISRKMPLRNLFWEKTV